ncbi:DNA-binding protein H-NS [Paraburkholderia youngii]
MLFVFAGRYGIVRLTHPIQRKTSMATLEAVQAKIAKLQARVAVLEKRYSATAIGKILRMLEQHSLSIADIEASLGRRPGRGPGATAPAKREASATKYADPKTGANWSGRGRAPAWIAKIKDRTKFLVTNTTTNSTATAQKTLKSEKKVKEPQPHIYQNPRTGATWSGRGRTPSWIAGARDRTKFLISAAETPENSRKVAKAVHSSKTAAPKKAAGRKAATKKPAEQ